MQNHSRVHAIINQELAQFVTSENANTGQKILKVPTNNYETRKER